MSIGAILEEAGVDVSFNTDDNITDSRRFLRYGAMNVRYGMSEAGALEALTLAGARALGLDDRVAAARMGPRDHGSALLEIADEVAQVFFGRGHFEPHDRFQEHDLGILQGLAKGVAGRHAAGGVAGRSFAAFAVGRRLTPMIVALEQIPNHKQ